MKKESIIQNLYFGNILLFIGSIVYLAIAHNKDNTTEEFGINFVIFIAIISFVFVFVITLKYLSVFSHETTPQENKEE